jgi:hypothetical protein
MVRGDFRATFAVPGLFAAALGLQPCDDHTTQGRITGRVYDGGTKHPSPDATVEFVRREQSDVIETRSVHTNARGFYAFSSVPPPKFISFACATANVKGCGKPYR